jgi:hypothetical protein
MLSAIMPECHYVEYHSLCLSVIMPSFIMLIDIILRVNMPSVVMLYVIMVNVVSSTVQLV